MGVRVEGIGFYIAIIAMKTGHPISYIITLAIVLIVTCGLDLEDIF